MSAGDTPLLTIERERGGEAVRIEPGAMFSVGRAVDADFVITDDPHVSAMHFRLHCRDAEWWLEDLGSRNGTYVNGVPVRQTVVHHHDRIAVGDTAFRVSIQAGSRGEAPLSENVVAGEIVNRTPFSVGTAYAEDAGGASITLVVKATWTIADRPALAVDQWPIFTSDQLAGDDPLSAVKFESDLVPVKPLTDVILVGRAYAAGGQPVTRLLAGLRIGQARSVIAVFGDRSWDWKSNGPPVMSAPEPFTEMELVYERAFGGIDVLGAGYYPYNVSGVGFIAQRARESVEGVRLPNLEDPQNLIASWDTRPKPMGMGFYGRGWMPRVRYAGKYEHSSPQPQSWPPPDFSNRFYNGAHPDLQLDGYLSGDEEVTLLNVCPGDPEMKFRLPGAVPGITIARGSGNAAAIQQPLTPVLDTLVFVPDEGVFYQVFRSTVTVPSLEDPGIARIVIDAQTSRR